MRPRAYGIAPIDDRAPQALALSLRRAAASTGAAQRFDDAHRDQLG